MRDKLLYISGKYRADTIFQIKRNIQLAEFCRDAVFLDPKMKDWFPICPHLNTAFLDGIVPDEEFLQGDLALVKVSQGIIMLPWWEGSTGSRLELDLARRKELQLFFFLCNTNAMLIDGNFSIMEGDWNDL